MSLDPILAFQAEHRFLSNFWPSLIEFGRGSTAPTVEHAYQAAKTRDRELQRLILAADTAGEAKHMGGKNGIIPELRPDWERVKVSAMLTFLRRKFFIPELNVQLGATGARLLVEGNTWADTFWGAVWQGSRGYDIEDTLWHNDGLRGANVLGRCLMLVRAEIDVRPFEDNNWRSWETKTGQR